MISPTSKLAIVISHSGALALILTLAFVAGCGQSKAPVAKPFTVPPEFSDQGEEWQRVPDGPNQSDNNSIGAFFRKHPDIVGSPEWTGQPEKYVSKKSNARRRFYWFSGSAENPSWNAIDLQGKTARQISGVGTPGS